MTAPSCAPLAMIAMALAVASVLATLALHAFALHARNLLRRRQRRRLSNPPPITVLKPLCGLDEGLYENLRSIVTQDYPDFEVVFGVADSRDPALSVVQRLLREQPHVPMRVVIRAPRADVVNPKIANLLNMLRHARYEHLLVSDSNVRVGPDYLHTIAAAMSEPGVALVSNVIVGSGDQSLGAALEHLHLNTFVAAGVCMGEVVGRPCVIGKSMLMRKTELAAIGGFESMRNVLAEDYVIGTRYAQAGYRVVLAPEPVHTYNRELSPRRFFDRHLRWAQLRRRCALDAFLCELLLYPTPAILLAGVLATGPVLHAACLALLTLRVANDALLARTISGRAPRTAAVALLPLKDCVIVAAWAVALFRRSVRWREHRMHIGKGSVVTHADRAASSLRVPKPRSGII